MKPKKKQKSPNRSKKDYGHKRQKETKEPEQIKERLWTPKTSREHLIAYLPW